MSIRHARLSDLEAILAIYGPYVANTAISFEYRTGRETHSPPALGIFQRIARRHTSTPWPAGGSPCKSGLSARTPSTGTR